MHGSSFAAIILLTTFVASARAQAPLSSSSTLSEFPGAQGLRIAQGKVRVLEVKDRFAGVPESIREVQRVPTDNPRVIATLTRRDVRQSPTHELTLIDQEGSTLGKILTESKQICIPRDADVVWILGRKGDYRGGKDGRAVTGLRQYNFRGELLLEVSSAAITPGHLSPLRLDCLDNGALYTLIGEGGTGLIAKVDLDGKPSTRIPLPQTTQTDYAILADGLIATLQRENKDSGAPSATLLDASGTSIYRHDGHVHIIGVSPSAKYAAIRESGGNARIEDLSTRTTVLSLPADAWPLEVAIPEPLTHLAYVHITPRGAPTPRVLVSADSAGNPLAKFTCPDEDHGMEVMEHEVKLRCRDTKVRLAVEAR